MSRVLETPVALVGLMGAGKSVVARLLGARWVVEVADLDARVESRCGMSIPMAFERLGEAWFREREIEALAGAVAEGAAVIDGGGGLVVDSANRLLLRTRCRTVWLEVSPDVAAVRIAGDAGRRPLVSQEPSAPRLAAILKARAPLYEEVAWLRAPTDGSTPERVTDFLLDRLGVAR